MKFDKRVFRDYSHMPNDALARWVVQVPNGMLVVGMVLTVLIGGGILMSAQHPELAGVGLGGAIFLSPLFILIFVATARNIKVVARRLDPEFDREKCSEQKAGETTSDSAPSAEPEASQP